MFFCKMNFRIFLPIISVVQISVSKQAISESSSKTLEFVTQAHSKMKLTNTNNLSILLHSRWCFCTWCEVVLKIRFLPVFYIACFVSPIIIYLSIILNVDNGLNFDQFASNKWMTDKNIKQVLYFSADYCRNILMK